MLFGLTLCRIAAMQVEETSTLLAQKNKLQAAWQHRVPAAGK
jgi:hypothetical protein